MTYATRRNECTADALQAEWAIYNSGKGWRKSVTKITADSA